MVTERKDLNISTKKSMEHYNRAQKFAPKGVIGSGRYWRPYPIAASRAQGSRLWDIDGNEFIDYHAAYGPAVLGHNHPEIHEAVVESLEEKGVLFALPHEAEIDLCEKLTEIIPSAEKTIFTCAGTEATYHAVRLARAYTQREGVLKFEGAYHGWHDSVQQSVKPDPAIAGDARAPRTVPGSLGTPKALTALTRVLPWNDTEVLEEYLTEHGDEIACMVVEPIIHSCGVLMPQDGFLQRCRDLCTKYGIVLIFDEIVTSFRHDLGGAQKLFGVTPDLTTFGKAVANGYPVSGLTGRNEIMSMIQPEGGVAYQGTYNGITMSMVAALKTIEIMERDNIHEKLFKAGQKVRDEINAEVKRLGVPAVCRSFGSVWCLYFTDRDINNYRDIAAFAVTKDSGIDSEFQKHLLNRNIYMQPYYANRCYISAAHTDQDLDRTIEATKEFLREKASLIEEANRIAFSK